MWSRYFESSVREAMRIVREEESFRKVASVEDRSHTRGQGATKKQGRSISRSRNMTDDQSDAPATPFVGGWPIDAMCEHLEAVTDEEIRHLLITIPPRHTKSTTVSIAWPTWSWIGHPEIRFMFGSYAAELSTEHAVSSRRVIESGFYQRHFGDRFFLVSDQNVKTYYENSRRGYRISTSVGGTAIGRGGDCLVLDDPHNLKTIDSDTARTGALEFFRKVWSQRFNNAKRGHHVIVMQRGHEDDLANLVMERGGFEHLNLPSEYERTPFVIVSGEKITVDGFAGDVQERDEVIATAKRKRRKATIDDRVQVSAIGWQDPRDADGELLWPERFGQKEIDAAKRDLLETGFATQHQQRPVPQEGAMFKRSKFKVVTQAELTDLGTDYVEARGWDFAATEETPGTDPDYTVVSDFSANGPTRGSISRCSTWPGKSCVLASRTTR